MDRAPIDFASVARLPSPGDNVAIAIRRLDAGEVIQLADGPRALAHTVLEGHRFAVKAIRAGEALLSWGHSFGTALSDIAPGDYVCNDAILGALAVRRVERMSVPARPNFTDSLTRFQLDERTIRASPPVERASPARTFQGYRRPGKRGI